METTYIVIRYHLALGNDLLVPFAQIIFLGYIDANQCSTLDLNDRGKFSDGSYKGNSMAS